MVDLMAVFYARQRRERGPARLLEAVVQRHVRGLLNEPQQFMKLFQNLDAGKH